MAFTVATGSPAMVDRSHRSGRPRSLRDLNVGVAAAWLEAVYALLHGMRMAWVCLDFGHLFAPQGLR
jgi:hypothetical protein